MEDIVQPQEFCVTNIFKATEYVIPIYQRNYAWTKDEIEQLLNDINDVSEDFKGKYYLGSLIVNQLGANVFEVIDGQQRLTTLYLLLSFLNNDSVDKNSLRFEAREKSNKTLQDINSIKDSENELEKEPWYSTEIIEGYSVIKKYFKAKKESFVREFENKLSAITLIRTQVPKDIDLNHYFEIMNTRGEQLELHEIVKAKIIGAIDDRKDKMIAATIWDACAQMDKYVQMCFSVDMRDKFFDKRTWDNFLCTEFCSFRDFFTEETFTVEKKFTLREKLTAQDSIVRKDAEKDDEENERFESIITFPNFILQVNEAINFSETDNDAGLDDKRFIECLKDHWRSNDKALNFIYSLLKYRYLFDRYIIKREYVGQYKVEGKWSLQKLEMYEDSKNQRKPSYKATLCANDGDNEDDDNKQLRLLQSCLRITYTSPKTMHWIARVLSAANKGENGKSIISLLERYCCKKIVDSDYLNCTGFGIDRIVFTYLDYVLYRDNPSEFQDFQFQFRTSIEHFFPQHPINGLNDVDEKNRDSFGNLALITVSANSKFSNLLPKVKVEQYKDVISQSPKLKRMNDLLNKSNREWNDDLVAKHNDMMLELLTSEIEKQNENSDKYGIHNSDDESLIISKGNNSDNDFAVKCEKFIKLKEVLGEVKEGVPFDYRDKNTGELVQVRRYTSPEIEEVIPCVPGFESIWGTQYFWYFEFVFVGAKVVAQFVVSCLNSPDATFEIFQKINKKDSGFHYAGRLTDKRELGYPIVLPSVNLDGKTDDEINATFEDLYKQLKDFERRLVSYLSEYE